LKTNTTDNATFQRSEILEASGSVSFDWSKRLALTAYPQ
jgi:hypothetical protein